MRRFFFEAKLGLYRTIFLSQRDAFSYNSESKSGSLIALQ